MKQEDHDLMLQNLSLYRLALSFRRNWKAIHFRLDLRDKKEQETAIFAHVYKTTNFVMHSKDFYDDAGKDITYISNLSDDQFQIFLKLIRVAKNRSMQRYRLRKVLMSWFDSGYKVAFVTLNPAPDFMDLKENVRRKYIAAFLSDQCLDYFANVDYAPGTGREHFHACCVLDKKEYHPTYKKEGIQHYQFDNFKYGFNDIQFVYNPDASKLADYTTKLINHALKSSTGQTKNIMRKKGKK